jgi:hypothetical protein
VELRIVGRQYGALSLPACDEKRETFDSGRITSGLWSRVFWSSHPRVPVTGKGIITIEYYRERHRRHRNSGSSGGIVIGR